MLELQQSPLEETIMKLRLAPAGLATQLHRPMRFGRRFRGHELLLRIIQVVLLLWLAVAGAKLIAHGVAVGSRALAGLIS
jgi:hypothetical protein